MSTYIGNTPEGAKNLQAQLPIGSVVAWPSSSIPSGWLECNGQSTTQYPTLNTLIGATVPDLRGEFIRGYDHGKGTDSGRTLLSSQADELKAHVHDIQAGSVGATIGLADTATSSFNVYQSESAGGTETRPVNVALMYIIKAFDVVSIDSTSGVYAANKNYIINPTFAINQRAFAGGAASGTEYTFDRWRLNLGAGDTLSLPDASGFITYSGASGALQHRVEDGSIPVGTQVTLSWEGTATATDYNSSGESWSNFRASPFTFTTTQGIAVSDSIALLGFTSGTLKNVKLEVGSIVTPFEYPDFGTELSKCQRYYWKGQLDGAGAAYHYGSAGTSSMYVGSVSFPVTMRTLPTAVIDTAGTAVNCTSSAMFRTVDGLSSRCSVIANGVYRIYNEIWTADAEL